MSHHAGDGSAVVADASRVALVGSPNAGKTTLFNALTGLRAKTGNYPGVTVARYEGVASTPAGRIVLEDLPGTYSLDPMSPDEKIVCDCLDASADRVQTPDAVLVVLDATSLRRSLGLLAEVLRRGLPTAVVLTFRDELTRRGGRVDVQALSRAVGVPVLPVVAGSRDELGGLRAALADRSQWPAPVVLPPTDPPGREGWVRSVLDAARHQPPAGDTRTERIDAVLLHPVWGTLIFFATMFGFFQVIFTVATPLQDLVQRLFDALGLLASAHLGSGWLSSLVTDALIGGVGSVVVFLPQIALLFVLIALLEGSGYLSRAAFLMDRVMARAGLEGRAFVALLSALACAIPAIMATRSLPSAKDRLATMMAAPLMTCSARLTVYVLLVGMLVDGSARVGPFGAKGVVMFGLYLGGAIAAMATAWVFKKVTGRQGPTMPFYMEMPSYRLPRVRTMVLAVWEACKGFLAKVGRIILVVTLVLWLLLNLPARSPAHLAAAGVDSQDRAAASSYVLDHSYAAAVGRAVEPVFAPLGFDWRIDIGIVASLSAREVFVATLGQVAAADNPDSPRATLERMRTDVGGHDRPLFDAPTIAALLTFFLFALQCMSTIAVMRRETGTWRWPGIAFGYMFVLAWGMAFVVHAVVEGIVG